jgi:hypothetical protein
MTISSSGTADGNLLRQHFQEQSLNPTSSSSLPKGESIIIIGAGAFGSSLALELVTHYQK